mgnify:CR=1 FL=1|jgi:hypothetical protein|tara:strand:- start:167 stop:481 length:315 start_codon:yes stop_codon:yes gene_type:complete
MPVLRLNQKSKALHSAAAIKKPTPGGANEDLTATTSDLIHAFDPTNLSMPKYSSNYKNEKNASAIRHLLGGRQDPGVVRVNSVDLKSSNLHWMLGLRDYNPRKD